MSSKKSVGPRMDPKETPTLSGYSWEGFPFRTTWNHLLLNKRRNKTKYMTRNSIKPKFVQKANMPNTVKSLEYIKCYSLSTPDLLKVLSILSEATVRRSAVDWEDLKLYWKSKRPHFSCLSVSLLFTSFSNSLLTTERWLTRQ